MHKHNYIQFRAHLILCARPYKCYNAFVQEQWQCYKNNDMSINAHDSTCNYACLYGRW